MYIVCLFSAQPSSGEFSLPPRCPGYVAGVVSEPLHQVRKILSFPRVGHGTESQDVSVSIEVGTDCRAKDVEIKEEKEDRRVHDKAMYVF